MDIEESEDNIITAHRAIEALQNFIKDELHLPVTLSEIGLNEVDIETMAGKATQGSSLPRAYRELTKEDCINIYKMCL